MIKRSIIFFILFLSFSKANSSIYIVDNYSYETTVQKIKKNRNKVIEDIKKKSLDDFIKSITIESDYKNLDKIKDYQEYLKTFIVKDEYKKNNNYEIICKIEFNKSKVDEFLKFKNLKYINYKSTPILTIIVSKKNEKLEILQIENFENKWNDFSNNLLNVFPLNGDLSDIKFINDIDVKTYQIARLDKLTSNYGTRDYIFILFDFDSNKDKENVFVRSQFSELKFSNKYVLKMFNEVELIGFFKKLSKDLNNTWKEIQILSPVKNKNIIFNYELKTLNDYIEVKKILKKNINIISLNDLEINSKNYKGELFFTGTMEVFKENLSKEGFFLKNMNGKINLVKK